MKILHLVHNYPPEFAGGTERYLSALVDVQVSQGHAVTVVAGSEVLADDHGLEEESEGNPRILRFCRSRQDQYSVDFRPEGLKGYLSRILSECQPDVVHVHHWFNLGNDVISFLKGCGQKVVVTLHDLYSGCARIFMIRPDGFFCGQLLPVPVERCVECVSEDFSPPDLHQQIRGRRAVLARELERADCVLVPSQSHGRLLAKSRIIERDRLHVLGHGLLREFRGVERQPREGVLRLGTWGHLSRVKGIVELLESLRLVHERRPGEVELHVWGASTEDFEDEFEKRREGLPVHAHGSYSLADIPEFSRSLDLAIFPSHAHESYSFVLDEACALRVPMIVSDRGALADRAKDYAVLVDGTDAAAIADAVESLLNDPDRLERMRQRLPEQPFTIADNARELEALYQEIPSP